MIAAVVVVVLVAVVIAMTVVGQRSGQTPVSSGQGGGNGVALQRVVADSTQPTIASITGDWAYSCNGRALAVSVGSDGAGTYSLNRVLMGVQVEARGNSTVAVIVSSDDAGTPVGTTMALSIQGGRLQIARGGATDSLLPVDLEKYNGEPLC